MNEEKTKSFAVRKDIKNIYFLNSTAANMYKRWNIGFNAKHCMQLYSGFMLSELIPPEHIKATVNNASINSIYRDIDWQIK